ncbi:translin associated factor X isoform X1 [Nomia melanderi]|uniref:translin associated factor X isoform X1 n=1 Tax=Nomia melanderi TaxID=2448451 RepID=UPI0013040D40|nr:translin-associated protein X isoform X1 [Nomia melanderi]
MSHMKGGRKNHSHGSKKGHLGEKGKEIAQNVDEDSLVMRQFRAYGAELDDKNDRFERILKICRDITIESKRIIYLLHTIDNESKQGSILNQAKTKLQNVAQNHFKRIALELEKEGPYQYLKAYRSSLEEYIEAVTFYQYLHNDELEGWSEIEKMITYTITDKPEPRTIRTLVTPREYILGIADLTGELMRKCINNLGTQDIDNCYQICNFVKKMYTGFLSCTHFSNKEMNRKLFTLEQSLHKIENVCYIIKVRGSEIPRHILIDVATENYAESDEGYQGY